MASAGYERVALLLATVLGGAIGSAQSPPATLPQAREALAHEEVVVTAQADRVVTAKVVQVLQDDPYVFADHISVVTENGVVRLQGMAFDVSDMRRMLVLARRVAGARRVINEIELRASDFHD